MLPAHPLNERGFRAWVRPAGDDVEVCKCGWIEGRVPAHYRMKGVKKTPNRRLDWLSAEMRERMGDAGGK
jgi:hypothetical protein